MSANPRKWTLERICFSTNAAHGAQRLYPNEAISLNCFLAVDRPNRRVLYGPEGPN